MKTLKNNPKGSVLIELLLVIAILGVLVVTGAPIFIQALRKSQSVQCSSTRRQVEDSVVLYHNDHPDDPMPSISQLVNGGYLNGWPRCSAGGEYVWLTTDIDNPKLGCSIHFWEEEKEPEEEEPEEEEPKEGEPEEEPPADEEKDGDECAIATACYGTPMAEEVKALCAFRDQYLLTNPVGQTLVKYYYTHSPKVANFIRDKEPLKRIVRACLKPIIWIISKIVK